MRKEGVEDGNKIIDTSALTPDEVAGKVAELISG